MKRHRVTQLSVYVALVVIMAGGVVRGWDKFDPLQQQGTLQEVAEPVGQLLSFSWSGDLLMLDRFPDGEETALFESIAAVGQQNGFPRSSGGGGSTEKHRTFERSDLQGELLGTRPRADRPGRPDPTEIWPTVRITLVEAEGPKRWLMVELGDQGLIIQVDSSESNYHLVFRQKPDGSCLVQEIRGELAYAAQESSFLMFCSRHRAFAEDKLFPLLKHLGLTLPETSHNPAVDAAVLARLAQPAAKADDAQFQTLLRQLDDAGFEIREQATRTLLERFTAYQSLLRDAANKPSYSLEVRTRISQILKSKADGGIDEVLARNNLLQDPGFLISLLERTEDEGRQELIASALQAQTNQSLGTNAKEWRAWADSTALAAAIPSGHVENPLTEQGLLQDLREPIGKLLKFTFQGGQLSLDTNHWQEPFGGKSVAQLEQEIQNEIRKRGFPTNTPFMFSRGMSHQHLLFQQLSEKARANSTIGFGRGGGSTTRSERFEARLVEKRSTNGLPQREPLPFHLFLRENLPPRRSLDVQADTLGGVTLLIRGDDAGYLLSLWQEPGGAVNLHELTGTTIYSASSSSFRALCEQHSQFANTRLLPLIEHLGVRPPIIHDALTALEHWGATFQYDPQGQVIGISLRNSAITDAGMEHLARLTTLRTLGLSGLEITDAGLAPLSDLTGLQRLDLFGCRHITDAGAAHLAGLIQMKFLNISGAQISDVGLEHLKGLRALEFLCLAFCGNITDAGLAHLKELNKLEDLTLWGCNQITDVGLEHLSGLARLRTLDLSGTEITDAGLEHLKGLSALTVFDVGGTRVTDAGLEHLRDASSLQVLGIRDTAITDAGLAQLRGKLPLFRQAIDSRLDRDADE